MASIRALKPANEEMADAKFVVVAEHFGDLLRRTDECGSVAVRAGRLAVAGDVLQRDRTFKNDAGLGPCFFFGVGDDRAH